MTTTPDQGAPVRIVIDNQWPTAYVELTDTTMAEIVRRGTAAMAGDVWLPGGGLVRPNDDWRDCPLCKGGRGESHPLHARTAAPVAGDEAAVIDKLDALSRIAQQALRSSRDVEESDIEAVAEAHDEACGTARDVIAALTAQVAKLSGENTAYTKELLDIHVLCGAPFFDGEPGDFAKGVKVLVAERDQLVEEVERLKGELEAASLARVLAAGTAVADRNAADANRTLLVAERDAAVARAEMAERRLQERDQLYLASSLEAVRATELLKEFCSNASPGLQERIDRTIAESAARAEKALQCHSDVPCGACITCLNEKIDAAEARAEKAETENAGLREENDGLAEENIPLLNRAEAAELARDQARVDLAAMTKRAEVAEANEIKTMRGAKVTNAVMKAERDEAVSMRDDAERWRAFLSSARIRMIGSAGLAQDNDYAHLSMEIWTTYPGVHDNHIGTEWLSQYADKARRALAARQKGGAA